jgi:hypothetical protein
MPGGRSRPMSKRFGDSHSLGTIGIGEVSPQTAGGAQPKAPLGVPSTPHQKERAEGPLHTAVGGPGGEAPRGVAGLTAGVPSGAIIRLAPAVFFRCLPEGDQVKT